MGSPDAIKRDNSLLGLHEYSQNGSFIYHHTVHIYGVCSNIQIDGLEILGRSADTVKVVLDTAMADAAAELDEGGIKRTLKDLFAGAAGGVAQVLLGQYSILVFVQYFPVRIFPL